MTQGHWGDRLIGKVAVVCALATLGCRAQGGGPTTAPLEGERSLTRPAVAPADLIDDAAQVKVLAGFDLGGSATCLPLPEGQHCLQRTDPVRQACLRQKGVPLVCDDCSVLCNKSVQKAK